MILPQLFSFLTASCFQIFHIIYPSPQPHLPFTCPYSVTGSPRPLSERILARLQSFAIRSLRLLHCTTGYWGLGTLASLAFFINGLFCGPQILGLLWRSRTEIIISSCYYIFSFCYFFSIITDSIINVTVTAIVVVFVTQYGYLLFQFSYWRRAVLRCSESERGEWSWCERSYPHPHSC